MGMWWLFANQSFREMLYGESKRRKLITIYDYNKFVDTTKIKILKELEKYDLGHILYE